MGSPTRTQTRTSNDRDRKVWSGVERRWGPGLARVQRRSGGRWRGWNEQGGDEERRIGGRYGRSADGDDRMHDVLVQVADRRVGEPFADRTRRGVVDGGARDRARVRVAEASARMPMADERRRRRQRLDGERQQDREHPTGLRAQRLTQSPNAHADPTSFVPLRIADSCASRRLADSECQNERPMNAAPMSPVTASGTSTIVFTNMMMPSATIA